jgi:hypothetical protein
MKQPAPAAVIASPRVRTRQFHWWMGGRRSMTQSSRTGEIAPCVSTRRDRDSRRQPGLHHDRAWNQYTDDHPGSDFCRRGNPRASAGGRGSSGRAAPQPLLADGRRRAGMGGARIAARGSCCLASIACCRLTTDQLKTGRIQSAHVCEPTQRPAASVGPCLMR